MQFPVKIETDDGHIPIFINISPPMNGDEINQELLFKQLARIILTVRLAHEGHSKEEIEQILTADEALKI